MEQFDQLLTCCVCLDRYRNPKLLPCQHSFCMEPCMEGLVDYVRRQVKCPECRAEHRIPYQGVQHFPTNVTLQRFLELHIDLTGELPDPTSNQIMERCQVCSEKAYCNTCAHCEKKVCPDCKEAHVDVIKREITRLTTQVRRVLHRLEDAVSAASKNLSNLKGTSSHVLEEVDDLCRRFTKAIKDKGDGLRTELDNYVSTELTTLNNYKTNLDTEISNIMSNCDVVERYVIAENSTMPWDDQELMDTKDLLLRTMEFIRNFEYEPGDRRIRFTSNQDPNTIVVGLTNFGDLVFPGAFTQFTQHQPPAQQQPQFSPNAGIMRSKSDHRLVQQYRDMDEAEQQNSSTRSKYSKYGSTNDGDERKFRSRFTRRLLDPQDDDNRVRFNDGSGTGGTGDQPPARTQARVIVIDDALNGPLSGISRLLDSTRVLEKMVELDSPKQKKPVTTASSVPQVPAHVQQQMLQMQQQLLLQQAQQLAQSQQPQPVAHPWRQSSQEKSSQKSTPAPVPRKQSTEKARSESESSSSAEQSGSSSSTSSSSHKSTGAAFTTEEVKQKFLKGNTPTQKQPTSSSQVQSSVSTPSSNAGAGGANKFRRNVTPLASQTKVSSKDDDDSDSSSEESEESDDDDAPPVVSKVADKTDIGSSMARSSNTREREVPSSSPSSTSTARARISARLSSTEDPPPSSTISSGRSSSSRVEEPLSPSARTRDPPMLERRVSRDEGPGPAYSAYRSRQQKSPPERTYGTSSTGSGAGSASSRYGSSSTSSPYDYGGLSRSRTGTALYEPESSASRLQSKYLNRSRHNMGGSMDAADDHIVSRPTGNPYYTGRSSYLAKNTSSSSQDQRKSSSREKSRESKAKILSRSKSSHELAPGEIEGNKAEDDTQTSLSSWARYLKSKYGKTNTISKDTPDSSSSNQGGNSTTGLSNDTATSGSGVYGGLNNPIRKSSSPQKLNLTASQYSGKKRLLFKFGSRGSDPGYFTWPRGIACGPDQSVVVADSSNHRIQVFDQQGNFVKEFGQYGQGKKTPYSITGLEFLWSWSLGLAGVAVNRIGQFIVSDRYNHRIQVFDPSGRFLRSFGCQGSADGKFNYPWGVTTDALGFIYVCDKENHRVQVFQSDGTFVGKFGVGELEHPHYIAVTCTNKVVVSDTGHHRVFIFDVNGKILGSIGSEGIDSGCFKLPRGVAVDEQGYIFVGDSGNNRIQIFSPDGVHIRSFGCWGSSDGEFKGMEGIAVNSNGNVLVCDRENHRIQVF